MLLTWPANSLYSIILGAFSGGAPGWLYDDSNMSTLYQDAAGTTPVTALEQPVGKQLDLSGRGNHRTQPTSANRPVWSARYSYLTKTELWTSPWAKAAGVTSATVSTAPDGTNTACTVQLAAGTGSHEFFQQGSSAGTTLTNYIIAKAGTASWLGLGFDSAVTADGAFFDLTNGVKGTVAAGTTATMTAHPQYAGWYICTVTRTYASAAHYLNVEVHTADNQSSTFNAAGTETIQIWHPDQRPSDQATGLIPTYQRVNTATDYDSVGFPAGLRWNGSNSWMQNASVDFSGTNKVSQFAGVRKNADTSYGIINELSVNAGGNAGTFYLVAPFNGLANFATASGGTVSVPITSPTSYPAPTTKVMTGLGDISAPVVTLRLNGAQVAQSTSTQGTGNYGNYPAYFGARAGTSLFFNGLTFSNVCIGIALSASQIAAFENWTNSKCRAY